MSRQVFDYSGPDRFVVGTVGMPGERTFFLQARKGAAITSVALEKAQVAALAERVDQLLDEAAERTGDDSIPDSAPPDLSDARPLDVPIVEEFRVGAMALGWDEASRRVVIEAHAVTEDDEEILIREGHAAKCRSGVRSFPRTASAPAPTPGRPPAAILWVWQPRPEDARTMPPPPGRCSGRWRQ